MNDKLSPEEIVTRLRKYRGPWLGDGINPPLNGYQAADAIQDLIDRLDAEKNIGKNTFDLDTVNARLTAIFSRK